MIKIVSKEEQLENAYSPIVSTEFCNNISHLEEEFLGILLLNHFSAEFSA